MQQLKRLYEKIIAAYQCYSKHEGPLLAAGIAYYLAFSLFPMMLVLVAVLGWAFRFTAPGQQAEQKVLKAISEQVSPSLAEQISTALGSVEQRAPANGTLGIAMLIVTALTIFTQIDYAFDRIWDDAANATVGWRVRMKALLLTRLKALLMLTGVGTFVLAVMIASLVWRGVQENLAASGDFAPRLQKLLQTAIHIALNVLAFTLVYRLLPKRAVRWSAAILGGTVASILWEVGRQVLAAYVVGDKLPTAYGLIGSFMAVMLWTYYAMIVLLFGAAFTRVLDETP